MWLVEPHGIQVYHLTCKELFEHKKTIVTLRMMFAVIRTRNLLKIPKNRWMTNKTRGKGIE
ncbi:MAG TPA: hypothetical protein D7I10_03980 [Candidatus Poseidoniales archaeon]|nr:MAG TPA: hypothetical protein D7I10_03980 [Candidatus Poseidoniales archaeon]